MKEQNLPLRDGPVQFAGAVTLAHDDAGVHPWRLVHDDLPLYEPTLRDRAADPAGVRLTWISDTSSITLDVAPGDGPSDQACTFDLLVDGVRHQRQTLPDEARGAVRFTDLPAGEHRLELYLPQRRSVRVVRLAIDDGASAKRWDDPRPKWLVYGSSITQCASAAGPSETWPAIVANRFDLNLTCLGYGGNCHMEPVVVRMMRDFEADYISLCLGINMMANSYSPRTFRAQVLGTMLTLRDGHPRTPMVVVSPICNPPRETTPNAVDLTLVKMRETIAEAVDVLRQRGDANVHYVDGLSLFGPDYVHHMPDELHPDAEGYRVLADRYAEVVMPVLGLEAGAQAV